MENIDRLENLIKSADTETLQRLRIALLAFAILGVSRELAKEVDKMIEEELKRRGVA